MKEKPIELLQAFKEMHYFKQNNIEKLKILNWLAEELASYYKVKISDVSFICLNPDEHSGMSSYNSHNGKLTLVNRLSLITFFHEVGHAIFGYDEDKAQQYAIDTFKYLYPHSFNRLISINNGRMLIKSE